MFNSHWMTFVVISCFVAIASNLHTPAKSADGERKALEAPSTKILQEMHNLRAGLTRSRLKLRYCEYMIKRNPKHAAPHEAEARRVRKQMDGANARIRKILKSELGAYVRVSSNASEDCSEEHYSEVILDATADTKIAKNELLLFHAGDIYRTKTEFRPLRTTGQGFFFRPDCDIPAGSRFTVTCIQDAREELANVRRGLMPLSDRARDPRHPYKTRVRINRRQ